MRRNIWQIRAHGYPSRQYNQIRKNYKNAGCSIFLIPLILLIIAL